MRFDPRAFAALLLLASYSSRSPAATVFVEGFVVVPSRPDVTVASTAAAASRSKVVWSASAEVSGPRGGGPRTTTTLTTLGATLEKAPSSSSPSESSRSNGGGSDRRRKNNDGGGQRGGKPSSSSQRQHRRRVTADSDTRTVEREVARLGRLGRTDDALALYQSVWDADDAADAEKSGGGDDDRRRPRPRNAAKPTTRLMNSAIDACARARPPRPDDAFRLWREGMDGGKNGRRRLSPNVFTFGALMSARARSRDADGALELLRTMQDVYKVEPNAVVYSTAISACERSVPPKPDDALKLLREASENPAVEMGVVGYNAALSALARAGEWRRAVRLLDEMEGGCDAPHCSVLYGDDDYDAGGGDEEEEGDDGPRGAKKKSTFPPLLDPDVIKPRPDEVTYGTVMAACERSEEWGMVLKYADALADKAEDDPAFALDGVTITSALHACQRLGRCDEALEYLEMMKELGGKSGSGGNDAEDDAAAEDDYGRRRTITRGRDRRGARAPLRGPDAVAYRLAISACARSRGGERWADGLRLLREMRERTGMPPDVVAYTAAIGGCAEAGQYELAFRLLEKMAEEDGVRPNRVTYNVVLRACATASARAAAEWGGDTDAAGADPAVREPMERALALLDEMKKRGGDDDAAPDVKTYNAAIRACAEAMSIKGAFDLMDDLRSRGLVPTVVTYGSLMTACERVGSVNCASKVFSMLKEQQQETDETLEANEIIYGAAISCCRKAGQQERTVLLLRKMIREGLRPNAATFNTVLTAQAEGKRPDLDRAALVYKLMGSEHAPGVQPNRQTYTILVRAFASDLRPNDAERFLRKMREDGYAPDVDLYTATVTSYERTRQPMKALRLMESMREDGYNFYDIQVLDQAFKKAIKLVNVVGQGLSTSAEDDEEGDVGDGDFDVDMLSGNTI